MALLRMLAHELGHNVGDLTAGRILRQTSPPARDISALGPDGHQDIGCAHNVSNARWTRILIAECPKVVASLEFAPSGAQGQRCSQDRKSQGSHAAPVSVAVAALYLG
jgi:hypothetical protein